jgi:hypothetical protein
MKTQQLRDELKQSMLAKDTEKTAIIRLILSAIKYYEIQKGGAGYEATDEDVLAVIQKEVKQRRDSIEQFQAAGRQDLVDKEQKELDMLQGYLPEQMAEEEIRKLVQEAIAQTGATSIQDMGKVMGALMPKTKGKADGTIVSNIVKEKLATS